MYFYIYVFLPICICISTYMYFYLYVFLHICISTYIYVETYFLLTSPTGKLEDGTEFDSSLPQNQPFVFSFGTGQVIKGWDQGLLGMCEGEKQKLMMPSELGYGKRGAPPKIPGGATLVFEVEVLKIERRSEL
uniref:peptidylprolyl isomerase n=1 Tax=Rattus norvegicus TaxID=10116 RepID=A0A8I5ZVA3_RAT